ncbi:MAG: superoxide dismutase family protein [Bdellovibrionales bacterium]
MLRVFLFAAALVGAGCAHRHAHHAEGGHDHGGHKCAHKCSGHEDKKKCAICEASTTSTTDTAQAKVAPLGKGKVNGAISFFSSGPDLKVKVDLSGLQPNQKQGFHIHEFGNCSGDGSTAGGHYNPGKQPHAGITEAQRHVGDLGNLMADAKGLVQTEITVPKTSLSQVLGRAVIVHAKEDDLKSQPSGAAGDRVACGVIGLTQ